MDLKGRRPSSNIIDAPPGTESVPEDKYAKAASAIRSYGQAPSAELGGGSMDRAAKRDIYKRNWAGRTRMDSVNDPSFSPGGIVHQPAGQQDLPGQQQKQPSFAKGGIVAHENKSYKMAAGGVVPDKWSALPSELRERNDTNFQQSKLLKKAISTNRKNPVNYQDEE